VCAGHPPKENAENKRRYSPRFARPNIAIYVDKKGQRVSVIAEAQLKLDYSRWI